VVSDELTSNGEAQVISAKDYYPFGMSMPSRSTEEGTYRYGFNGKETDHETGIQDYGMRWYLPNIARFPSVDPITKEYPELTPYQFASNRPIQGVDLDGLELVDAKNTPLGPISIQKIIERQDNCEYTYSIGFNTTYYPTLTTSSGNSIRLMSHKYSKYRFRIGNNDAPLEKVTIKQFYINVTSENNQTTSHEVVVYDADADADYDGPNAQEDHSGAATWSTSLNSGIKSAGATKDEREKNHWTWSLDGTTDLYSAIPSRLKNDFNILYGDIVSATYNGKTGIGVVADGSGQKIGELSARWLIFFGVDPKHGNNGISTRDVRYMIFKNTSQGEHAYPTVQNDIPTQKYIREASGSINDSINNDHRGNN
jgi:RHS repeat-associated protein